MRFALLTRRFPPEICGVGDYTFRLAEALQQSGHEVVVFAGHAEGHRPPHIPFVEIPVGGWKNVSAISAAIRKVRPDRVLFEYSPYGWSRLAPPFWINVLALSLRRHGIPLSVALHEHWIRLAAFPARMPIALLQRLHIALLVSTCEEVLLNLPERVTLFRRWFPWLSSQIHFRPNSSTIPVTPVSPERKVALRSAAGAAPDSLVVVLFGLIAPHKNYEAVVDAITILRRERNVRLWVLGDHPSTSADYITSLREKVRLAAMEEIVFWSGALPPEEISAHLQAADVFVLPQPDGHLTRSSSFLAAAAHGLPCIVVENCANQTQFTPAENLLTVPNSSAELFANTIRALAVDASRRAVIGQKLLALYAATLHFPNVSPVQQPLDPEALPLSQLNFPLRGN